MENEAIIVSDKTMGEILDRIVNTTNRTISFQVTGKSPLVITIEGIEA